MPGWSKAKRSFITPEEKRVSPGPGQYPGGSPGVTQAGSPQWGMGTSQREQIVPKMNIPGPGSYATPILSGSPKYAMRGKYYLKDKEQLAKPGPGMYNPKASTVEVSLSRSYSFRGRVEAVEEHKVPDNHKPVPGPGAYNFFSTMTKAGISPFGKEERPGVEIRPMVRNPGPGSYSTLDDSRSILKTVYRFGSSQREGIAEKKCLSPGPAAYNPLSLVGKEGRKFSIYSRREQTLNKILSPGPAAYSTHQIRNENSHSYSFGKLERGDIAGAKKGNPAPGQYECQSVLKTSKECAPAFKIGNSKRSDICLHLISPGPVYEKPSLIGVGSKISMSPRLGPGVRHEEKPGPGAYSPLATYVLHSARAAGMGYGKREPEKNKTIAIVPGPGTYVPTDSPLSKAPSYGFGSSTRPGEANSSPKQNTKSKA